MYGCAETCLHPYTSERSKHYASAWVQYLKKLWEVLWIYNFELWKSLPTFSQWWRGSSQGRYWTTKCFLQCLTPWAGTLCVCVRRDLPIQIDHLLTCNNLCFAAKGCLGDRASVTSHCCLCSLWGVFGQAAMPSFEVGQDERKEPLVWKLLLPVSYAAWAGERFELSEVSFCGPL